jgi:purine nucleosidase
MDLSMIIPENLLQRLEPPAGRIRVVLDTDAFNEVDDQFALAYALKSPERLQVEAVYAAPFHNSRSTGPADGMRKSYQEILKIYHLLKMDPVGRVFAGSEDYLTDRATGRESPAAHDLVRRALNGGPDPLYVVAIGAITNVASAILLEPAIAGRIVVVWLGGHALSWPDTREFNLRQDPAAAHVVLEGGVPLVLIPCQGVASHMLTTVPELDHYLSGRSDIGTYLANIVRSFTSETYAWSKVIWDVTAVAWLINPAWVPSAIVPGPILTDQLTWACDSSRHPIRCAYFVRRDPIFADLFHKLAR